jgi:hypothetical protein
MSDQQLSPAGSAPDGAPRCPWCSAALPSANEPRCPSCGAAVREETVEEIPGVTRIDAEAILRARSKAPRSRGLVGWLAGDAADDGPPVAPGTFAPPSHDVKREMLRLELAALEAEVKSRLGEIAETSEAGSTGTASATSALPGEAGVVPDSVDPDPVAGPAGDAGEPGPPSPPA